MIFSTKEAKIPGDTMMARKCWLSITASSELREKEAGRKSERRRKWELLILEASLAWWSLEWGPWKMD